MHPGHLNDSRCNRSSTEAGVLLTCHGPAPPEGGRYYHWCRDSEPHCTIPPGEASSCLPIRHIYSAPVGFAPRIIGKPYHPARP
ncbi:hypothetical protein AVEN_182999-1 [Araneus ventricosus]|uniref:Uncharacterized protein n=1 Tax=Araneus ventricosus TaxID=182803 RepID=A0A4Y2WI66_ARAVE|nr:hypothetical protein AVEN_182999-1 [Araneus ventricosus]